MVYYFFQINYRPMKIPAPTSHSAMWIDLVETCSETLKFCTIFYFLEALIIIRKPTILIICRFSPLTFSGAQIPSYGSLLFFDVFGRARYTVFNFDGLYSRGRIGAIIISHNRFSCRNPMLLGDKLINPKCPHDRMVFGMSSVMAMYILFSKNQITKKIKSLINYFSFFTYQFRRFQIRGVAMRSSNFCLRFQSDVKSSDTIRKMSTLKVTREGKELKTQLALGGVMTHQKFGKINSWLRVILPPSGRIKKSLSNQVRNRVQFLNFRFRLRAFAFLSLNHLFTFWVGRLCIHSFF